MIDITNVNLRECEIPNEVSPVRYLIDGKEYQWTEVFHDNAYELVKDRKIPITIPSYNKYKHNVIKGFFKKMTPDRNYPVIIFVRESQYQLYKDGPAGQHPYTTIVSFPDKLIMNAGAARRQILKWLYNNGYDMAFSIDDDTIQVDYTYKALTEKGDLKSKASRRQDPASVFAMWQLSMEKAVAMKNVMISSVSPMGFSWKPEYCTSDISMMIYRGTCQGCVCLNVKGLVENGFTYYDNTDVGHEDIHLVAEVVQKGFPIAIFPFLAFECPPMSAENFTEFGKDMQERFKSQQAIMKAHWSDVSWMTFRDKREFSQVVINWQRYRKENNVGQYIFDIWNHGELIGR